MLEIWNKTDLLSAAQREKIHNEAARRSSPGAIAISACGDEKDIERVRRLIGAMLSRDFIAVSLNIAPEDGALLNWVLENSLVRRREIDEESGFSRLELKLSGKARGQLRGKLKNLRSHICS
jgi:50S ribosomal subunit-associated GTPase HflX